MMNQLYPEIFENPFTLDLGEIPVLEYDLFYDKVSEMLSDEAKHCVAYYGIEIQGSIKLICCIANDNARSVSVFSARITNQKNFLKSLTPVCPQIHIFEREIHENFGVSFEGHPWLKPVRYPYNRADEKAVMDNYPFYEIDSEELHEVGVGPYMQVLLNLAISGSSATVKRSHLEIQLGYQHRGSRGFWL